MSEMTTEQQLNRLNAKLDRIGSIVDRLDNRKKPAEKEMPPPAMLVCTKCNGKNRDIDGLPGLSTVPVLIADKWVYELCPKCKGTGLENE